MRNALVTGATGFIGHHLVQRLLAQGTAVKCLVRSKSRADHLSQLGVTLVQGELEDVSSLSEAVKDADVVYHLAGVTKSVRKSDLMRVNGDGTKNLSLVCSRRNCPPTLVLVSSLAAAGPSTGSEPRIETDPVSPVSCYGRSKRAGELAVMDFADELPVTIVRPPIVFGEHDRDVFQWFRSIDKLGLHFAAGLRDFHYSLIHADDLAGALILAAEQGGRVTKDVNDDAGIYYAACDEVMTFSEMGRLIGDCVGRSCTRVVHVPMFMIRGVAVSGDLWARLRGRPTILNLDKTREAAAGSWVCSAAKLQRHTGFVPSMTLQERVLQTAKWYTHENWI
ncbi:MAG: NAD-dependent epimerase/dehydratase family protein [Rubripirellula sp.]